MKLFRVACFVPATSLHDVMTYLEGVKAYNVEVATVATEAKPKPNGPVGVKGHGKGRRYEKDNTLVTLEFLERQESSSARAPEIRKYFAEQGRSPKSVSSKITEMLKRKLILRKPSGHYEISAKGRDHLRQAKEENPQ